MLSPRTPRIKREAARLSGNSTARAEAVSRRCSYRPSVRRYIQWLNLIEDHVGHKPRASRRHGNAVTVMTAVEIKVGDVGVAIDYGYVVRRTWTQPRPMTGEKFFGQYRHERMRLGE